MIKLTQFYHTKDPIENLRIHVRIRKITEGDEEDNNNDSKEKETHTHPVGTTFGYTFTWQEKKFSPKEIKTYRKILEKKKSRKLSHLETIYSRQVGKLSPPDKEDATKIVCLSSYVDIDNYVHKEELKRRVTSSESDLPHLVQANTSRNIGNPTDFFTAKQKLGGFSNAERLAMRMHREITFKSMHLMATFPNSKDETLLCTLKYFSDCGLLCVSPGFSPMIDTENDPELFIKGPKLLTYKLTSSSGAQYEYIIDNLHDLDVLTNSEEEELLRELTQQEEKKDQIRMEMWKNRAGGAINTSELDPHIHEKKMVLQFEMVSAKRIESENPVFIKYSLLLPPSRKKTFTSKWQPVGKNQQQILDGQTQVATSRFLHKSCYRMAHFGCTQSFHLLKSASSSYTDRAEEEDEEEKDEMFFVDEDTFVLLLRVYSRDSYARVRVEGYAEVTIPSTPGFYDLKNIRLWRPRKTRSEYFEELYIGIDPNLEEKRVQDLFFHHQEGRQKHGKILSRLGLVTESTGVSVRVRLSVAYQYPSSQESNDQAASSQLRTRVTLDPNVKIVKRGVNEILKSLKMERKASKDMAAATATTLHSTDPQVEKSLRNMSVGGESAVESILAGLRSKKLQIPPPSTESIKEE